MDVYIKRDHVMQALTYVGTAEPTDIIPLTLAAARKAIMRLPTAELEQLAEIERLKAENEKLTINMNAYGLTAKRLAEENESLEIELENMRRNLGDAREGLNDAECEVERLRKALDEYEETSGLKQAKADVAREIFEEIQSCCVKRHWNGLDVVSFELDAVKYADLKKKYTGENADGI